MKLEFYNQILFEYRKSNHRDAVRKLHSVFPECSADTLMHIASQEYHRVTKKNHWRMRSPDSVASLYSRFDELRKQNCKPGFLLDIADSQNMAPALLAKAILEKEYSHKDGDNNRSNKFVNSLLKDTTLIEDAILAVEVYLCVLNDYSYGPYTDASGRACGLEYEERLKKELKALNLSFIDEVDLRNRGYDKTPDIKLDVPFAVSGQIVNWVESKASFGDPICHKELLKDQYWSYINRFGPGMVIYWFGFVDELDIHRDQGILLFDHLPTDITYMKPDSKTE